MEWLNAHVEEIWFLIIGFFVLYYSVADGYDLGVGMIALSTPDEGKRGVMMASLQSVWQTNQTWLVLLGGMLFGAFPFFYSVALSAFYVPIVIMLFGLIFRGIALELRDQSTRPHLWSLSFGLGSLVTALAQGFTLGGIFYGVPMEGHTFTGTMWSWFHPYSAVFALGVLSGYTMLGANYLILKTTGDVRELGVRWSFLAAAATAIISIVIYAWTIARHPFMAEKWQAMPSLFYVALFPVIAAFCFTMCLWNVRRQSDIAPFFWNAAFVFCAFIGISVGFHPYIIPNMVTIKSAAVSSSKTLIFMLAVMVILLPVILGYIGYKHWVFRGKVEDSGYED